MKDCETTEDYQCSLPERRPANVFSKRRKKHRFRRQVFVSFAIALGTFVAGAHSAAATDPSEPLPHIEKSARPSLKGKKDAPNDKKDAHSESISSKQPMDSAARAQALDKVYGYKGWNIIFPSFADSLTQDDGYWRTRLASYGFGFQTQNSAIFQGNILNTPRSIPSAGFLPCQPANIRYNCAGGRSYAGQQPLAYISGLGFLTYDMSQWGVPDGQIAAAGSYQISTDQQFSPTTVRFQGLSWYQTLDDKKFEFQVGYFPSMPEFAGTFVGGLVTSPFGPSASVPVVLGQSPNSMGTPNFRATWNITGELYAQTGIQRSLPVNGPTGNPIYDEVKSNPSGFDFTSSVPGTRILYTNELGYKRQAAPGNPFTWLRTGLLYNTSTFKDYSRLLTDHTATKDGALGFYALGDYQIWQQDPSSPNTAYRGIYLGGTFMYGPPETTAFTQYYEARAYWFAPFDSRPRDMFSIIYSHNKVSKNVQRVINSFSDFTNFAAIDSSNSITASYMFNIRPGLYATFGAGYTDKPSLQYFKGEGSSLSLLFSIYAML
ncbi:carbohydrate porin [Rhizobium rhizogenes]|uniref:carbohydrate porin n=1 Tax=Rhizobium rhizogenes TaxID=359 RepID=UPI0015718426|nr:carbohydrate porin [Rhizobium rhizogenes]NTH23374.1 carbohydrate porin [Rhizobium rhizogenes]NTH36396.1 carbohydrate porin [Rhizobium rhizogenes]